VLIPASNVQDLMLRRDVVEAVAKGEFNVWSVRTIDQGLEVLTGERAGEKDQDSRYPAGSINGRVDARLLELAQGLKTFAATEAGDGKKD
jgi:predicted ATP-dependent protease